MTDEHLNALERYIGLGGTTPASMVLELITALRLVRKDYDNLNRLLLEAKGEVSTLREQIIRRTL